MSVSSPAPRSPWARPACIAFPAAGGTPTVVATGFTNIIDIALSPSGQGYVLEHDADGIIPPLGPGVAGRLIRINADGSQTVIPTPGLVKPGGMAFGSGRRALYHQPQHLPGHRRSRAARSLAPVLQWGLAPCQKLQWGRPHCSF